MAVVRKQAPPPIASTENDNPRAVIGDNRPPVDVMARADFNEAIDRIADVDLRARINALIDSAGRASATNDDDSARCAELIRQMKAVLSAIETVRKDVKEPYLKAGKAIDEVARALSSDLGSAESDVRAALNDYLTKKQRELDRIRREQEEAARQARAEAEVKARAEQAAAAEEGRLPAFEEYIAPEQPKVEEKAQVRSVMGGMASTRKVKVGVITDYAKAFKAVRETASVREAIEQAIQRLVKAGMTNIPGVTIEERASVTVR